MNIKIIFHAHQTMVILDPKQPFDLRYPGQVTTYQPAASDLAKALASNLLSGNILPK